MVGIIEKEQDLFDISLIDFSLQEGAHRFLNSIIKSYTARDFLVSQNFGNLSDINFNGIEAKLITLNIKDKKDKISFDYLSIYFIYGKRQYYIVYVFYPDFSAVTKTRIESIVYSFIPKES
jgi:hypothetical protein